MTKRRKRWRRDLGDGEAGFTMLEAIIAAAMAVVITGAATAMLISLIQRQPDITERADLIGRARIAVDRMVRDVRQGIVGTVSSSSGSKLQLETYVDGRCGSATVTTGTKCKVVIECAAEICTRTTGSGTTSTAQLVAGVKNASSVFSYIEGPSPCTTAVTKTPTFVGVTLELRSRKGGVTKIEDGAGLRSC